MRIVEPSFLILDALDRQSLALRIEYCGRVCYKSEERITSESALPFVQQMIRAGHRSVLEMAVLSFRVQSSSVALAHAFLGHQPRFIHLSRRGEQELLITASIRALRELCEFNPNDSISQALVAIAAQAHPYFFSDLAIHEKKDARLRIAVMSKPEVEALPAAERLVHSHLAVKFIVNRAVSHELVRHRPCSFLQESQRYCSYAAQRFGGEVTFIKPIFYAPESEEFALWEQSMLQAEQCYLQLLQRSSPQAARCVLPNSCKTELILYANFSQWRHIFSLRCSKAADPSMRQVMVPLQAICAQRYPDLFSTTQTQAAAA